MYVSVHIQRSTLTPVAFPVPAAVAAAAVAAAAVAVRFVAAAVAAAVPGGCSNIRGGDRRAGDTKPPVYSPKYSKSVSFFCFVAVLKKLIIL